MFCEKTSIVWKLFIVYNPCMSITYFIEKEDKIVAVAFIW